VRAVTVLDGRLEWRSHPDPVPGKNELLVRVEAAGVNSADLLQRAGLYPAPPGSPADIPGMELAGLVESVGEGVQSFQTGDRVMAVVGGGGQAELAIVHERMALSVPEGIPWPEAGGFPEAFTTAHDALVSQCQIRPGERVLVHGAAGGVGSAAVQLAVAAGARVLATVRGEAQRAAVAEWGAEVVAPDGFAHRGPFDVIVELIGAPNMASDLAALASGGRIAVIGVGGGATAEVNLLALMAARGRIHGSTLRARPLEQKADAAQRVRAQVMPLLASARVQVAVSATFPMHEAEAAYDAFAAGGKLGKIVLMGSRENAA
jgi:NADPH2:quinone reductase